MDREQFEIERKYLIVLPSEEFLRARGEDTEIVQTYLLAREGETARVRRRGKGDRVCYTHTLKRHITDIRRVELEREVDREEYERLLSEADPERNPIRKTRWCLPYRSQMFEIDVFPFWSDRALMEIELEDEDQPVEFPPGIRVLREVTEDGRYTNSALSKEVPFDAI